MLCITNMLSLDEKEFTANGNTAGLKKTTGNRPIN